LDVNVGLPEIDEPRMMEEVVKELQSIIDLPLQIDTSDMAAMERAMRIYNGKPLINFDLSMYRKFAPRHGVDLAKARKRAPEVFRRPDTRRHGSYQAAQQARLDAAIAIDEESALESTFWGMFQIGGFNWKRCGAGSVREFVDRMSRSERDQLELFAAFIRNSGMVDAIRDKNWLAFALKYNGPKAKARRYHTRLAAAYRKHGGK
ncbi:MAG: N-acetylmuramidase domain-containing protein, partial [Muribaculaceae bacterium]|nr:N-acetylmuramidase domain-containing protein [Muribaculaceae bacterium]